MTDFDSVTFLSIWFPSGKVKLSKGEYRETVVPGSAQEIEVKLTDKRAIGIVNGSETAAVVLVTQPGGSGIFYDLALLSKGAEGWTNTDTVLLGDRVKVHAIGIRGNEIIVDMTAQGPGDPVCCPTLQVVKHFAVRENHLEPVAGAAPGKNALEIVGPVWQWVQTLYNDGKKVAPAQLENYTVQFREDGKLNVKADCNLKGGVYSIKDSTLSIEITHSTMAACPEGSFEDQFVRDLTAAAIYFLKDGDLYIDLKYDSGTMKFTEGEGK
jgi:heat shock protein HslJ